MNNGLPPSCKSKIYVTGIKQSTLPGINKMQKHFQNVMLVGMASKVSKKHTYKCVDCSVHNRIKGAMTKIIV